MKENEVLKQPFFARFLETQKTNEAGTQNIFGIWPITSKAKDDFDQTQKFPSDGDEDDI
jgi:hypothetical protein